MNYIFTFLVLFGLIELKFIFFIFFDDGEVLVRIFLFSVSSENKFDSD